MSSLVCNKRQPTNPRETAELKLAGFIFKIRFTTELHGTNMSNVIFVVGDKDGSTGVLSEKERDFLSDHNAELIELQDGKHPSMFEHPSSSP